MSQKVAVTTVHDAAAAEVAKEALFERGIDVEVRRVFGSPYLGSATPVLYEVRVAEEAVEAARAELERLAEDLEQAVLAQSDAPPSAEASEDERGPADLRGPEERPRKISWALVLSALFPVPGAGCFYARANPPGFVLLGIFLGVIGMAVFGDVHYEYSAVILAVTKLADLLLAPFMVVRFNRKLKEKHAAYA
jgi:hypothetical protein